MNPTEALLIPKLPSYFAEFLNECSLKRLRILSSSTCVGLRYGYVADSLEVFLGSVKSAALSSPCGLVITLEVEWSSGFSNVEVARWSGWRSLDGQGGGR